MAKRRHPQGDEDGQGRQPRAGLEQHLRGHGVNGILYFSADDGVHGHELWRSDGTARGTRMVKDINPGPASGGPGYLTNVNGTLFFVASDGTHRELWRSDGTEAGTTVVKEIGAAYLTDVAGTLFFNGDDGSVLGAVAKRRHRGGDEPGQAAVRRQP